MQLHRPTALKLKAINNAPTIIEKFIYQDAVSDPINNLNGQATHHYDASGLNEVIAMDFNGSPLEVRRTLVADKQSAMIDWQGNLSSKLENDTWIQITECDALKRVTRLFNWHRDVTVDIQGNEQSTPGSTNRVAIYALRYSERGVLKSEAIHIRASKYTVAGRVNADTNQARTQQAIIDITYDAKGQRQQISWGTVPSLATRMIQRPFDSRDLYKAQHQRRRLATPTRRTEFELCVRPVRQHHAYP